MDRQSYDEAKRFVIFVFDSRYGALDIRPEHKPDYVIETFEKKSFATACKSVSIGISDVLTETAHWDKDEVRRLDERHADAGVATLTQMRAKYWSRYKSIVKRRTIRNEGEFYIIKAMYEDTDAGSPEERQIMCKLLSDFEGV